MAVEDVVVSLKADLNRDGSFETDWTEFLRRYSTGLGRDTAVDRFSPRRASFVLDNRDSRFSPRNTAGPYSPNLKRGRNVRLTATITIPATVNLMRNPSAETNLTFWTGVGFVTISRPQTATRFGKFGVECLATLGATYGVNQDKGSAPALGNHVASVYVKGDGDSVGEDCRLRFSAQGGAEVSNVVETTITLLAGWQRIVSPILNVVETDRTELTCAIERVTSVTSGEKFNVDALLAEKLATSSIYCDGDQPECVWDGTVHASTSTRAVNPTINIFTGQLREFNIGRRIRVPEAEFVCTGASESILRTQISGGPFARENADLILQRWMNIIESAISDAQGLGGELIVDPAFRFGGDTYTALGGATVDSQKDKGKTSGGGSTDDPIEFDSLEGDNVLEVQAIDAASDGWQLDVTSRTTELGFFHSRCFFRANNSDEVGLTVNLQMVGPSNTEEAEITLTEAWQYVEIFAQFDPAEIGGNRFIRMITTGAGWGAGGADTVLTDCLSMSEPPQGLTDTPWLKHILVGTKWQTELEYMDAFERSAGSILEELAKSVGGWFYEDGTGYLVFEDYSQRDNAVISIPTMRISDEPQDGHYYQLERYSEPADILAGVVKVGSFGDVTSQRAPVGGIAKIVWIHEPRNIVFTANEIKQLFADYTSEGEGARLIARRAVTLIIPTSGWAVDGVQTPYIRNYGRSGQVTVKAPGGGKTAAILAVGARIQNRETTSRSFIEFGGDVSPIMELDMPAQAEKTVAMNNLLIWALTKYNASPATMEVLLSGAPVERLLEIFGRTIGTPVWVRHVTGPGNLSVDALFYTEGVKIEWVAGTHPRLIMMLEEGT